MKCLAKLFCGAALVALPLSSAGAQIFLQSPDYRAGPVTGSEPGISLPLPGATSEEYAAALLWNLRAGLNVAALQCHAMKTIDAVPNYNAMLDNHGPQLRAAYERLQGYFKRTAGSIKAFDDYNTKTYNSFSTLFGQNGFCQTAGSIGRDVLFAPRGALHQVAQARMSEFRNSLKPAQDRMFISQPFYRPVAIIPNFGPECYDKKGRFREKCLS